MEDVRGEPTGQPQDEHVSQVIKQDSQLGVCLVHKHSLTGSAVITPIPVPYSGIGRENQFKT